jgi:outer membrane protein TolC
LTRDFENRIIFQMHFRILAGLAVCATLTVSAQTPTPPTGPRALSLRECIDAALSRNLDLQIQHLTLDIARFDLSGAYGAYTPTLAVAAGRDFVSEPANFDPKKPGLDFPYDLTTDSVGPNLSGRLPMGLSYDLNAVVNSVHALTDFNLNPATAAAFPPSGIRDTNNYWADAGLTVQQHLLKDFWIDKYRETLLVRQKDLKISQQMLRFQIMKTVLAVELGYYDLVAAREQIRVDEKALELKKQLVAETHRRVEVGDLPPLDGEQAETQLQNALTALTGAREIFADRQNALKNLLTDNFKEWADVDLQPADPLLAMATPVNRSESFRNALQNRPDLVEARLAVERSDVSVRFRMNQLFPSLDFIGRYGGIGSQADLGPTLSDVVHFRNPEYFYGAVVSVPLGNVAERNSYKASKTTKQIAELQLKKAEQELMLQVADVVNRVQSRFSQVGSTRQARTFAEAALAAEQKKLQNGLSTSFVVLQLQEILTSARTAEILALADYNRILAQLAFAEGSIMEKHHLELEVK